jgi:GDP-L-fucose synthase
MQPDTLFDLSGKTIWVAGETGLVGAALTRRLSGENVTLVHAPHRDLDLTRQKETEDWLASTRPDVIILAAARVGGIGDNAAHPADFIYTNLAIAQNVIHGAYRVGVKKLLFLGSSCIYPKMADQPIREEYLLSGPLEPTNEYYALAKIAGLKMCQAYRREYRCDFIAAMPTNLYGPGDRFDETASHVIPAMILKMHRAKMAGAAQVELWGTGAPLREFLFVDDLADGLVHILLHYSGEMPLNIGCGQEVTIESLARSIQIVTGYNGLVHFNPDYPDGTPRKKLDCSRLDALGWRASTPLMQGLEETYRWFVETGVGVSKDQAA